MLKILFLRILLPIVVALLAFRYFMFGLVVPVAALLALVVLVAEFIGPAVVNGPATGASLRLFVKAALPVLLFPAIVLLIEHATGWPVAESAAAAAIPAACLGFFGAGHGQGRDHARLAAVGVAALLPLYVIVAAVVAGAPPRAIAFAVAAAAVSPLVARQAGAWPGGHEEALMLVAGVAAFVASGWFVASFV